MRRVSRSARSRSAGRRGGARRASPRRRPAGPKPCQRLVKLGRRSAVSMAGSVWTSTSRAVMRAPPAGRRSGRARSARRGRRRAGRARAARAGRAGRARRAPCRRRGRRPIRWASSASQPSPWASARRPTMRRQASFCDRASDRRAQAAGALLARQEAVSVDQARERLRLAPERMDHVAVVDDPGSGSGAGHGRACRRWRRIGGGGRRPSPRARPRCGRRARGRAGGGRSAGRARLVEDAVDQEATGRG